MGAAKVLGGVLALVGGILALLVAVDILFSLGLLNYLSLGGLATAAFWSAAGDIYLWLGLIFAIIVVLGSLLGMSGKKIGAGMALIIGLVWLLGGFLWTSVPQIAPVSALLVWTDQIIITSGLNAYVISIEALFIIVGSLVCLAASSD